MTAKTVFANAARDALELYLDELARWNSRMNLTSVDPAEWWTRHIDESAHLSAVIPLAHGQRIVDVGSGAGIPGLPLAILRPDSHVTLVEADQRKAGFLTHAAGVLGLGNVDVAPLRAEVMARDPARRDNHDVVVSRATAALPMLCELCLPLLRRGGSFYAMVADAARDVVSAASAAALLGAGDAFEVAHGIVRIDKIAATPDEFPRRVGVAGKRPITG